ncbi:MAG: M61 family metallopeptidase [Leptothrix sp. (in: b-proteobacteria)]
MIHYRVEIADLHAHLLRVTLTLPRPAAVQRLSLPVWIPGSYLVREFARHLSQLDARQGKRAVELQQLDKCSWQASCKGSTALTLSYLVYAFDASVRTAWLDTQRGFFNGTSLFLRCEGREAEPQRVQLAGLPAGWDVATAMAPVGKLEFEAADYDELIDHPFELGAFWRGRFEAGGVEHEFVVAGAWPGFDGERLLADTQKICAAQIRFWHGEGAAPMQRYVFMLNAVDDSYGGLEHRASTALICARRDLPRRGMQGLPDGYVTLLGLISHEYFHTWNVKRLKPADFAPYDLTRENYTELLWFFEGFTSYYDDLFLLRCGLIDATRYTKLLAKTINQVLGTPGRKVQSVAQASFDAWVKYYRPDENTANATVSYYTKGSLIALALDLTLRGEGRGTLDAVLHELWRASAAGSGSGANGAISEADIAAALQRVGGRDYAAELAAWVHGTAELPLAPLLASVGLDWSHERANFAQRLGARLNDTPQGLKVHSVQRGSAAEQAGLAAGDELIALDDWRLTKLEDAVLLATPEAPQRLLVARDKRLLALTLPVAQIDGAVQLTPQAKPTAAIKRRRDVWLQPAPT